MNTLRTFLIVSIFVLTTCKSYAIDPYAIEYGSEYTQECYNYSTSILKALSMHNNNDLDKVINNINIRLSKLSGSNRARFYQKFSHIIREMIRKRSDKNELETISDEMFAKSKSFELFQIYAKEAEEINSRLFKEEKKRRNHIDILSSDRIIKTYSLNNWTKFANGDDYTTDDLKASGELLISKSGKLKAKSFSNGWRRIITYNKESVAPGWWQINIEYYDWPYCETNEYPTTYFFVKDSDLSN